MASRTPKTDISHLHQHGYAIDGNGNGRTATTCHPNNSDICHSHQIISWVIQEEKSSCYPNCAGIGAPGVPMHTHTFNIPEGALPALSDPRRGIYNRRGPQGSVRTRVVNTRRSAGGGNMIGQGNNNTTPGGPGDDQGTDGGGGSY